MKRILLLFSLFLLINIGYCQKDSVLTKDSISKIKKIERKKANDFIINAFGKEAFDNYFRIGRVEFYKKTHTELPEKNIHFLSYFVTYKYIGGMYNVSIDVDSSLILSSISDYNYSIISYNLHIRGFETDEESKVYVIHDKLKDSCFFYNQEVIPPFLLQRDTNNFISNEQLLKIIQKEYSRKATWNNLSQKYSAKIDYFPIHNTYVYNIKIILKESKLRNYVKYKVLIIDAYNGKIMKKFIYKEPRIIDTGRIFIDNKVNIE